jgi:hypothetical protein
MQALKALALRGTALAQATSATIRARLLKIGACVIRNTQHPLAVHLPPSLA